MCRYVCIGRIFSIVSCLLVADQLREKKKHGLTRLSSATCALHPSVVVSSEKIKQPTNTEMKCWLHWPSHQRQWIRVHAMAFPLIRHFYCIISPASVSFYTVQWHFTPRVNTCLYKVVRRWSCVCRQLQARQPEWPAPRRRKYNVQDSWDYWCGKRCKGEVTKYFIIAHSGIL